jgi:hypothetical protein
MVLLDGQESKSDKTVQKNTEMKKCKNHEKCNRRKMSFFRNGKIVDFDVSRLQHVHIMYINR